MRSVLGRTAAWRISIWTTVAFAVGTAGTFSIVYFLVARGIRARSDAWLSGEAEVLAQVAADTPRDHLYNRAVGEVAELASRELPDERNARGQQLNSVFFLEEDAKDNGSPLWVGPSSDDAFLNAIHRSELALGVPQSLRVDGWPTTFRVVVRHENARTIYLGLSSRGITHALHTLTRRFLLLWAGTVLVGFLISYASARRTLLRVERITETVGRIGTKDLGERLPEPTSADEISRLAKTFNRMLARIQSSVTELRMVTDAVAHDLKSPVTSIRCTLEAALSDESNEQWRDSICEAIEGLDRLLNLLNTTLDVAEAQAGALSLDRSTVDFSGVVRQLADLYLPSMAERHHELEVDVEDQVRVEADANLLQRVVSNLLENELAHLPPGCQVAIRLRSNNGSAELVVEDNGSGFPPDVVSRAFERFVKGKQSRGHGLGLAFVGAVVRAHGGTATISDNPAGGAVVTLSLPRNVPHAAQLDESAGRILTG
jgi:signal transduction histidine kinase